MKPLVTVLIDTYNHEAYIEQAIVSVLEQRLSPSELEILVVDDGSTDKTPQIVQKFVPQVRHLRKENGGQASAFNAAFRELNGQTVAFLDGDDWFANGKLTTVMQALEKDRQAGAAGHGYYRFDESTQEFQTCTASAPKFLHLGSPDAAREALLGWSFMLMGALTVRREILNRVMPIPEELRFTADAPIAMAAMAAGVHILPQPLFYYRQHRNNLYAIDTSNSERLRRRYEMEERMCELLEPMLLGLGLSPDVVNVLLFPRWTDASRFNLRTRGGSRLTTFRIEMRDFHLNFKNPKIGYRLYKYLLTGGLTLLLPPRKFYELRDWYERKNLGQLMRWLRTSDSAPAERTTDEARRL